jgi:hypothetical protein
MEGRSNGGAREGQGRGKGSDEATNKWVGYSQWEDKEEEGPSKYKKTTPKRKD